MAATQSGGEDASLVARHLAGDPTALGVIYERYADRVYDLALAMLHSPDDAADAFQDTFLTASQKLGQLRDPERLRPWLYSIARNQCRARLRGRKRTVVDADAGADVGVEVEMTRSVERAELQQLMVDARAGLSERDQEVLDLHMRHGLDGEDLAAVLGVSTENAYKLVQRVRARVERSLGALLVARHARADCAELRELLQGWDGSFSPIVRKRVGRHVDGCDTCSRRRRSLLDPSGMASAMPITPAPVGLRADVGALLAAGQAPTIAIDRWRPDGFPAVASGRLGAFLTVLTLSVLIVLVTVAVVAADVLGDRASIDEGSVGGSTTSSIPETSEPPTTTAPASTSTTTTSTTTEPPSTTSTTASSSTTTSTTTTSTTTTTTTPAPDPNPPDVVRFTNSDSPIVERNTATSCATAQLEEQTTVLVLATDDTGVTSVNVEWVNPNGTESGAVELTPTGQPDTWSASLAIPAGTFATTTDLELRAIAADGAGNADVSDPIPVTVIPCP